MSTNPFRRSSLRTSGSSNPNPTPSDPIDIRVDTGTIREPLSVNTKVGNSSQKHVNFASPPAVPIPPASYPPSSPESARPEPPLYILPVATRGVTDYTDAIHNDPFRAEASNSEVDGVIQQALQNARVNTERVAPDPVMPDLMEDKDNAVKNTLSRFATGPKRAATGLADKSDSQQVVTSKQTMDVDAFKRLLLTGESASDPSRDSTTFNTAPVSTSASGNSSSTDTASTSHRSIFDHSFNLNEASRRSSSEIDPADTKSIQPAFSPSDALGVKKPPPPPKSRYGKSIKDRPPSSDPTTNILLSTDAVLSSSDSNKQPPMPPISRRRSQNSGTSQNDLSRQSLSNDQHLTGDLTDSGQRPPPPPPTRRPGSLMERRTSTDLPPTMEESDSTDTSAPPSRKPSDSRPPPPPTRTPSAVKRMSLGTLQVPPLPPPRRGRGSSRSSIDSQRPSFSGPVNAESTRSSAEYSRPGMESRKVSSGSTANDILADLAMLQREVDEARRQARG